MVAPGACLRVPQAAHISTGRRGALDVMCGYHLDLRSEDLRLRRAVPCLPSGAFGLRIVHFSVMSTTNHTSS